MFHYNKLCSDIEGLFQPPKPYVPSPPNLDSHNSGEPLREGWISINVDIACPQYQIFFAIAAVTHYHLGHRISSVAVGDDDGCSSVVEAELIAILWGLKLANQLLGSKIVIHLDSTQAIQIANSSRSNCPWFFSHHFVQCSNLMSSFSVCHIVWIARSSNECARNLARKCTRCGSYWSLFGSPSLNEVSFLQKNKNKLTWRSCIFFYYWLKIINVGWVGNDKNVWKFEMFTFLYA